MSPSFKQFIAALGWMLVMTRVASAQLDTPQSTETPNWMGTHTWFILLALGALLAWGISYSIQLQKESLQRRKGRDELILRKETILNEIAALESRKDTGEVSESRYEKEFKELKVRLSRVIEQLGAR